MAVAGNILAIAKSKLPRHPFIVAPAAQAVAPDIIDRFTDFTSSHKRYPFICALFHLEFVRTLSYNIARK